MLREDEHLLVRSPYTVTKRSVGCLGFRSRGFGVSWVCWPSQIVDSSKGFSMPSFRCFHRALFAVIIAFSWSLDVSTVLLFAVPTVSIVVLFLV